MSSRISSEKWISTIADEGERKSSSSGSSDGRLILNDLRPLFQPVWNSYTNLISIFGRARQGKSFLMNCLSGEQNVFKVSNYKESCTQGIDISNKFVSLPDFSKVDGGRLLPTPRGSQEISVGFVDAEGQGDKDISYDANLICPILLASKCVIFNWKGDLQKDHILSTLGIMTRAAKNVSTDGAGHGKKKFGHLHIVFRDWQAVGSDAASTHDILFSPETSKDAQTRNQIREEVKEAFESIQVWLFDAPTESVQALRQVLTIDITTPRFRQQIRDFRAVVSQQLSQPVYFANHPLTGKGIYSMMKDVVQTLNRGEVILPASTYLTMMKEEVSQLVQDFDRTVKATLQEVLEDVDRRKRYNFEVKDAEQTRKISLYLNTSSAIGEFRTRIDAVYSRCRAQILEIIALPAPPAAPTRGNQLTPYELLYQETVAKLTKFIEETQQTFLVHYQQSFIQYLRKTRQNIETEMDKAANALQQSPSLSHSPQEYQLFLQKALYERYLIEINYQNYYTSESAQASATVKQEIDDIIELLQRYCKPLLARCLAAYEKAYMERQQRAQQIYDRICQAMEKKIPEILQQLVKQQKQGFAKSLVYQSLDEEYSRLDEQLKQQIAALIGGNNYSSPFVTEYVNQFYEHCAGLREQCVKEYETIKEQRLFDQWETSHELLNSELLQLSQHWETECSQFLEELEKNPAAVAHKQPIDPIEVKETFQQLVNKIWKQAIASVIGWMSDVLSKEKLSNDQFLLETPFGRKLRNFLEEVVKPFYAELVKVIEYIEQRRQQKLMEIELGKHQKASAEDEDEGYDDYHDNQTVQMEEDDYDDAEEEQEEEEEEPLSNVGDDVRTANHVFSKIKQNSKVTIAEQRRRAREFAERVLGVDFNKKSSKKKTTGKAKGSGALSSKKSTLQQREAARQFAMKNFGGSILEDSADEEEEEAEVKEPVNKPKSKRSHEEFVAGDDLNRHNNIASSASSSTANKRRKITVETTTTTTTQQQSPPVPVSSRNKSTVTPSKAPPASTISKKASTPSSGKKEEGDPVAAAKRALLEEQAKREREAIEKATKQINQKKQQKASSKK